MKEAELLGQEEGEPKETGVIQTFAVFSELHQRTPGPAYYPESFSQEEQPRPHTCKSTPERPLAPTAAALPAGAVCELTGGALAVVKTTQTGWARMWDN